MVRHRQGSARQLLKDDRMKSLHHDYVLTLESAFVIRTFFFVLFGMTVTLSALLDVGVLFKDSSFRSSFTWFASLLLALGKRPVSPLLYIAPRG